MIWMLWGALALLGWQLCGLAFIWAWRPRVAIDAAEALQNMMLWPAGVVMQFVVWRYVRHRKEWARQQRITEKVASGEYDAGWALRSLNWKGPFVSQSEMRRARRQCKRQGHVPKTGGAGERYCARCGDSIEAGEDSR